MMTTTTTAADVATRGAPLGGAQAQAQAPALVRLRNVEKSFRRGGEAVHVPSALDLDIPQGGATR